MNKSAGIVLAPARISVRIYRRFPSKDGSSELFGEIRVSFDPRSNPEPMIFDAILDESKEPPEITYFSPIPARAGRESEIGVDLYMRCLKEYLSKRSARDV